MGPLSDHDVDAIVKSLGISSTAIGRKLDRLKGTSKYTDVLDEAEHLDNLLERYRAEQARRRRRNSAA